MEKIIERVQKLLALAGNNPSEIEAAAAIEKAHEILALHNLTMQTVREHNATTGNPEDDVRDALSTDTNYSEKYYAWLWMAVAEANYCKMWRNRPSAKARQTHYVLVGRKINALVAAQMAMYLCETVKRLANEDAKRTGRKDHAYKNAFIAGACHRLHDRVKAMRYGDKAQQGALVLWTGDEEAKNDAFIKAAGVKLVAQKTKSTRHNSAGLAAGKAAGDNVSLAQQVGASAPAKGIR